MNTNECYIGDTRGGMRQMIADGVKVHTVVTSPPYFGLRDYGTAQWEGGEAGCDHRHESTQVVSSSTLRNDGRAHTGPYDGEKAFSIGKPYRDLCGKCGARRIDAQIGLEESPAEFIATMVNVFRLVRELLADDGTVWCNMGDSYGTSNPGSGGKTEFAAKKRTQGMFFSSRKIDHGLKPKDLLGMPWRLAFALQADGWYLRQDIIWHKPNPMPESVTDRCTKAHEMIFLLTKSPRYFFDAEAIAEPSTRAGDVAGGSCGYIQHSAGGHNKDGLAANGQRPVASTRNKRSVWTIPSQAYPDAHFACVDEATECLTANGWLPHQDLLPGMRAAQFDISTCQTSWGEINEVARYEVRDQEMVVAHTRDLDMVLTPNHRCVIHRRHPRTRLYQEPAIIRADALLPSHAVPTSSTWSERGDASIPLEWAELLGWYVAEGHESAQTTAIEIYQSDSANPQHVARIEQLLRQVGAEWTVARYERSWRGTPTTSVAFRVLGYAAHRLRELAPKKAIPTGALLWSEDRIKALLLGLVNGDGHTRADGRSMFVQKDAARASAVQALAFRAGLSATLSKRPDGIHTIYLTKHRFRSFRGTAGIGVPTERQRYTGVVWCPRTPHGTWIARRNGRIFITGNTFPEALVEPCILAGTSQRGHCPECGKRWVRVVETGDLLHTGQSRNTIPIAKGKDFQQDQTMASGLTAGGFIPGHQRIKTTTGWQPSCTCSAEPIPDIVFDPFMGSGTVARVAQRLGRSWLGCELSGDYVKLQNDRTRQQGMVLA